MVYVNGINVFLPNEPVFNDQIENVLGVVPGSATKARRLVLRNNGIEARYYAINRETGKPTHSNSELSAVAVRGLLAKNDLQGNEVDLLACGTSGPDQLFPSHAAMVHGELGIDPCEVLSVSGVCGSSVGALKYAYLYLQANPDKQAVVTGSEIASKYLRSENFLNSKEPTDELVEAEPNQGFGQHFLRWMLSDGAAALLLQGRPNKNRPSLKIEWIDSISYANEMPTCMYAGCLKKNDGSTQSWLDVDRNHLSSTGVMNIAQDVQLLNEHIVEYVICKAFAKIAEKRELKPSDIDFFVPHYSSKYFKPRVYDGLTRIGFEIPYEKWFTNLTEKGNVGSASIFISLEGLMTSGKLEHGQKILCFVPESSRFSVSYFYLTVIDGDEGV
ncbi:MAG: beta-ketoacyl-ACP synthase III [Oligoflexales bacterium]